MDGSSGKSSQLVEPVRDEHDVASTFARRAIGDAQVAVHRIARLREHGGSLSRGAGRAVQHRQHLRCSQAFPLKRSSASRCHHLHKTFWGWRDRQLPDGTLVWTSPHGQSYTTHPGSRLLFPRLCRPTAPVITRDIPGDPPDTAGTGRGLMMPRRKQTRAQQRANTIADQRRANEPWAAERIAERNKPPPF